MRSNSYRSLAGVLCLLAHASLAWAGAGFGPGQNLDVEEFLRAARAGDGPAAPRSCHPGQAVEWVAIKGGKFAMGADNGDSDAKPLHEVAIKTFEMSKALITVEQYAECVIKGVCTEPGAGEYCNWGRWTGSATRSIAWTGNRPTGTRNSRPRGCPASPSGSTRRPAGAGTRNTLGATRSRAARGP